MHTRSNSVNTNKQGRSGFLSADPHKAMQEMMDTIDHMRGVYEQETEALESLDARRFVDLQQDKIQATDLYKTGIQEILKRKDEMKRIDPSMKRDLERMQNDFATLSQKNMNALKRMQKTMERLGETIQHAAKESLKKQQNFSYGESGRLKGEEQKRMSIGVSETA